MVSSGLENFLGFEVCWMKGAEYGFMGAEAAIQKRREGSEKY